MAGKTSKGKHLRLAASRQHEIISQAAMERSFLAHPSYKPGYSLQSSEKRQVAINQPTLFVGTTDRLFGQFAQ